MALKIINPANGNLIKELQEDTPEQIKQKFVRAKAAQPAWAATPLMERLTCIRNFKQLIADKKSDLAKTLTEEVGKPIKQSHNELNALAGRIDFFLDNTTNVICTEGVFSEGGMTEQIEHEPLGVIGNISAWNYPYFVGSNVFVPALLTGNAVLYKPSEYSTLTGLAITEMLLEAGIPKDVFIPIIGGGAAGTALTNLPLNGMFFTGSYNTGVKIAQATAPHLMRLQLELGGKDPAYICDDADVANAAASTADGAMYNTGQSCCSVERIYVHEKVYDTFIEEFLKTVQSFKMGDPMSEDTYIGPLARRELQIKALEEQVEDAKKKGAKILCGGKKANLKGFYFEPTVLTNVNHTMLVMTEESFGPIIGIQKVSSDDEALQLMNDSVYGLTAGVYSKNQERAIKILAKVRSGSAYWNCCDRVSPRLPWSGRGHSGVGSTLSTYGILAFVQQRGWHLRG